MGAPTRAEMLETLAGAEHLRNPGPGWAALREHHPVLHDRTNNVWTVSRYDDVVELLSNHETYSIATYAGSTGAVLGETLIQMDGSDHVWRRAAVAPEFVGRRLDRWTAVVDTEIDRLIDAFPASAGAVAAVDLVRDFSRFLPVNVIVAMLGFGGTADMGVFRNWVSRIMAGLAPHPERRADAIEARREFANHIAPLMTEPVDAERSDLIGRVCRAEHDGRRLAPTEVIAFLGLLFIAGGETTDKAIGNLWWNLLSRPELLDECRSNPDALDACFTETMRVDAPVVAEVRFLNHDVELHGRVLPEGALVRGLLGAANRDPSVFEDADTFDHQRRDLHLGVERRTGAVPTGSMHLGFGLGKHFCLGYQLARREAVRGSERLLAAMPGVRFADPDQAGPTIRRSMRSLASLPLVYDSNN